MKNRLKSCKKLLHIFVSAILVMSLFVTSFSAAVNSTEISDVANNTLGNLTADEYTLMHENQYTRLYCALSGDAIGTFAVENVADGSVWYSVPLNASEDTTALNIAAIKSLITFTYYDEKNYAMVSVNSYADSAQIGGLNLQKLKNGLRFNFTFPKIKITVPLTVLLNDDGSISAKVDVTAIKEESKYKVFDITVLPYFCVAEKNEQGFIFVPDGTGAVMKLNNGKTGYEVYNQSVYGGDSGEISTMQTSTFEKIYMPVYGLQKNDSSIFTVITSGAAQSSVLAAVSGTESDYNCVRNTFTLRKVTTYSLDQGWQGAKSFSVYQETPPTIKTIENRYWFLSGKNAGLSGMAAKYREYLNINERKNQKNEASVFIDVLGSVIRTKSVMGFPRKTKMVATSFQEAQEILSELKEKNINSLNLRYVEWDSRSVSGKIVNKAKVEAKLGSKKEFLKLAEYAKQSGYGFYPDIDPTVFSKTSYPFQQYFAATKNMNLEVNRHYPYKLNIHNMDTDRTSWFVLSFKKLEKTSDLFLKSFKKLDIDGLALSGITNNVTSDYSDKKNTVEAWMGCEKYSKIIENYSKEASLMLDAPIFSNISFAEKIINLPESSGFDMLDYSVPFYQMVISGKIAYSGRAANLSDNADLAVLKALKTGSNLHYSLSCHAESDIVKDTLYDEWIGTDAVKWISTIEEQYKEIKETYEKLGSQTLIGFEHRESGITVSYFESGGELWANETNYEIEDNGITLSPKSYCIRKAGKVIE